jgi:hypothetical protein
MPQKAVVFEIGSKYIRAGFAGEPCPRYIGETKDLIDISDKQLLKNRITDLFHWIFINKLIVKAKDYSVLVVEKLFFTSVFRNQLFTVLLRDFEVIAFA